MSVMSVSRLRAIFVSVALVAVMSLAFGTSASATHTTKTFNNASVNITGGNATALAACVNYAQLHAKWGKGKAVQNNRCKNFAKAQGGNVTLKNVDITIFQSSSGGTTQNNATVNISGGDATAIAACVNFLSGGASAYQKNKCANTAVARGGDVSLKNVTITIVQE